MKETILVTGCAGFIASHLCEHLLQNGHQVIGIDNFDPFYDRVIKEANMTNFIGHPSFQFFESDITNPLFYADFENDKIDVVAHLAGKAGVRPSLENPQDYIQVNVQGTNNVLNFMNLKEIKNMVFASSSSVYGNGLKAPFEETALVGSPISPYAFSKRSCELMNYTYHHLYDLNIVNLRFFTVYGPRQRPDLAINKFFRLMRQDSHIPMYGDGQSLRDYTFVDDIISGVMSAIDLTLQKDNVFEIVNLGNNKPISLSELINIIGKIVGTRPKLNRLSKQAGDVDVTCANIQKAKDLLGYSPKTTIEQGLASYYSWYLNQKS